MFSNRLEDDNILNVINFVILRYETDDFDKLLSNQDTDSMIEQLNINQKRVFGEVVRSTLKFFKHLL